MKTNNLISRWIKLSIGIVASLFYGMTVQAAAPTYAPTNLVLTANSGEKSITLTCRDNYNTNVTYYIIQRQVNDGAWDNAYATAMAVGTKITYVDMSLSAGKYGYRVVAHNDSGNSPASAIKSATIVSVPNTPLSLTAVPNNISGTVSLNWVDASSDETGFIIQRQVNGGTWNGQYATVAANTTTYLDNNLGTPPLATASYAYRICASSANGNSAPSNEASVQIANLPSAPSALRISTNNGDIVLSWTDNSNNETSFQLEMLMDSGSYAVIGEPAANVTTWTSTPIAGDHTYFFKVRAVNPTGFSAYSNQVAIFRSVSSIGFPEANEAPVISALNPVNVYEGENISRDIIVTDINAADTLTLTTSGLPAGASLTKVNSTWILNWRPNFLSAGTYPVTLTANDGTVNSAPVVFNITVNDVPTNLNLTNKPEWFTETAAANLISDNLVWNWNAFAHPASIPFVYEYSLNNGAWTETIATSYTGTTLSEGGNQSLRVRVKLLTTPQVTSPDEENADSFGIDNTPPALLTLALNEGNLGTSSSTVNLSLNSYDALGQGSGIVTYEASIDGGAFAVMNGTTVTLPSVYGNHTVVLRGTDRVGYVSGTVSDDIMFARNISMVSGTSSDATQVILKDLRSNLEQTEDVSSGSFQFSAVPDGIYGLVLKKNNAMKGFEKRISIHNGIAVDLGEITIGTVAGGRVSGALLMDNVSVAVGIDLGQGMFLKVNESVSVNGTYTISDLARGNYSVKAMPDASTQFVSSIADVTVVPSQTTQANLSFQSGNAVTGSSNAGNVLVQAISSSGDFKSTITDSNGNFSMVLPSGDYQFVIRSEYVCIEPQVLTVNTNLNLPFMNFAISNAELSGGLFNTAQVLTEEVGINKALQVFSGIYETGFMTSFSGEYDAAQTIWSSVIADSMTADSTLYLMADDMVKGIHSFNRVDAANDSGNFTVNSAGGSISGVVTLYGTPVVKPQLILIDSLNTVVGTCQGSSAGEYFFKNVPIGTYTMKVLDTQNDTSKEISPLSVTLNENTVLDVEFVEKKFAIMSYEAEVADGKLNADIAVMNLDESSNYTLSAAVFNSDWTRVIGNTTMPVVDGLINIEVRVAGNSGNDCHLKVVLYKNGNTIPEGTEIKNGINIIYFAKTVSITAYEPVVTDGVFNATVKFANLEESSSYKLNAAVFSSDWTTVIGSTSLNIGGGSTYLDLGLKVTGASGSNCHLKIALYKNSNTIAEDTVIKNGIEIIYLAKTLNITAYETQVTDGVFNATVELANLEAGVSYKLNSVIFSSDWSTVIGSSSLKVSNGSIPIALNVAGKTGVNCHLKVALYKGTSTTAEASEIKNLINIS